MGDRQCLFCGAQLDPGVRVSRTMIKGHIQVSVVEYPCPRCAEGTEFDIPHRGEFSDKVVDLLGDGPRQKAEKPTFEAAFDDDDGWVFALL